MAGRPQVQAWRPAVAGVAEVFHAAYPQHSYPMHTHEHWTLLIVDAGRIGYDLHRHDFSVLPTTVTLLPPHIAHDGHTVTRDGFRKRVIYLEEPVLGSSSIGRAVDRPGIDNDRPLRAEVALMDRALVQGEAFEAESRLALTVDRLRRHLARLDPRAEALRGAGRSQVAAAVRDLLDTDITSNVKLAQLSSAVGVTPSHVVRAFTQEFGLPPHRYVTGRRLERARMLLLGGSTIAEAASWTGFHDQAHFHRHFMRLLGTTPASYQRGGQAVTLRRTRQAP